MKKRRKDKLQSPTQELEGNDNFPTDDQTEQSEATESQDTAHSEIEDEVDYQWSYEVPRPWLSLKEASSIMGRSQRALERSILGRWGNKLPEGWSARKVSFDGVEEWRIIPPPGFRIKHNRSDRQHGKPVTSELESPVGEEIIEDVETMSIVSDEEKIVPSKSQEEQQGTNNFSLEKLFHQASQMAKKELSSFALTVRNQGDKSIDAEVEHATIVIDRSDEVEKLLRELADTQKELSEQRKMHLEDLRLMQDLQMSMRRLEVNAQETNLLKNDLEDAQKALIAHKRNYEEFLALPWWKRLFRKLP